MAIQAAATGGEESRLGGVEDLYLALSGKRELNGARPTFHSEAKQVSEVRGGPAARTNYWYFHYIIIIREAKFLLNVSRCIFTQS